MKNVSALHGLPLGILLLAAGPAALGAPAALGGGDNAVVAISSRASADYVRQQLPDGSYQAETFVFGKGGVWGGSARDATIDKLDFMDIARTIALPLSGQGYISSRDPRDTKLLVMVYWGTTHTPDHPTDSGASQNLQAASAAALAANAPQLVRNNPSDSMAPPTMAQSSTTSYAIRSPAQIDMDNAMTGAMAAVEAENHARDQEDAKNASMLGYDSDWDEAQVYKGTPLEFRRKELVEELEEKRYFVVLMAYDFQMMWKQKKAKLLWETRYSIRERGNDFSRQLAAMTQDAASYFGRSSGGLIRKALPSTHVEIGAPKVLDYGNQQ
jgi:hypothetical protein